MHIHQNNSFFNENCFTYTIDDVNLLYVNNKIMQAAIMRVQYDQKQLQSNLTFMNISWFIFKINFRRINVSTGIFTTVNLLQLITLVILNQTF